MEEYSRYCIDIAVVVKHGLDEGFFALVRRYPKSLIRGRYCALKVASISFGDERYLDDCRMEG
jgi:hypothetical protein